MIQRMKQTIARHVLLLAARKAQYAVGGTWAYVDDWETIESAILSMPSPFLHRLANVCEAIAYTARKELKERNHYQPVRAGIQSSTTTPTTSTTTTLFPKLSPSDLERLFAGTDKRA